jgi:hypothetical protein
MLRSTLNYMVRHGVIDQDTTDAMPDEFVELMERAFISGWKAKERGVALVLRKTPTDLDDLISLIRTEQLFKGEEPDGNS